MHALLIGAGIIITPIVVLLIWHGIYLLAEANKGWLDPLLEFIVKGGQRIIVGGTVLLLAGAFFAAGGLLFIFGMHLNNGFGGILVAVAILVLLIGGIIAASAIFILVTEGEL